MTSTQNLIPNIKIENYKDTMMCSSPGSEQSINQGTSDFSFVGSESSDNQPDEVRKATTALNTENVFTDEHGLANVNENDLILPNASNVCKTPCFSAENQRFTQVPSFLREVLEAGILAEWPMGSKFRSAMTPLMQKLGCHSVAKPKEVNYAPIDTCRQEPKTETEECRQCWEELQVVFESQPELVELINLRSGDAQHNNLAEIVSEVVSKSPMLNRKCRNSDSEDAEADETMDTNKQEDDLNICEAKVEPRRRSRSKSLSPERWLKKYTCFYQVKSGHKMIAAIVEFARTHGYKYEKSPTLYQVYLTKHTNGQEHSMLVNIIKKKCPGLRCLELVQVCGSKADFDSVFAECTDFMNRKFDQF